MRESVADAPAPATAAGVSAPAPHVAFAPVVTLMALIQVVCTTDFSIVSVALPSIGRAFAAPPALLSWVVVASALALASLLMIGGRMIDRIGHRSVLTIGLVVFAAGSVVAGLAPSIYWLLAARALQGAAVALISPGAFALIPAFIPEGPDRHRALGVFGMTQGVSLILGLLLGGGIVSALGWRGVFFINLPLIAVALWLTLRYLPKRAVAVKEPIDFGGAATITLAIVLLVTGISAIGEFGPGAPRTIGLIGGAVAMLGIFAAIERRVAAPLVPPGIFGRPAFKAAAAISLLVLLGVGGLLVLSQVYMQRVLGYSAAMSGLGTMPYAAAVLIAGNLAPRLLGRFQVRQLVIGAMLLNATGLLILAATVGEAYAFSIAPGMAISALGSVTAFIVIMGAATDGLRPAEQGVGTALLFTCQQLGVALGASIGMTLIDNHTATVSAADFRVAFVAFAAALGIAVAVALVGIPGRRAVAIA
ncbi:MFS transporter [Sphingosinicellaceae bacterium]|nr:MFS transporter [Sphingosinicellaceae bacterium]